MDDAPEIELTLHLTDRDEERIAALLGTLPVASRASLGRHALRIGLAALEVDPLGSTAPPAASGDALLLAAAVAYAEARHSARGRALKIAQAREALDFAVDAYLARRG